MDSTKNFVQLSPLVSLAMAVVASFCIVNAQLALAHRPLRPSPSQDGPTDFLDTYDDAYGCGFFSTSDPEDAGISHQACYGSDGAIEFCCLSGNSKCSCPLATGSELGCYNYEAGNTLNAKTGDECGYFLPKGGSSRRQLPECTCPPANTCNAPFTPFGAGSGEIGCNSNGASCTYNATTGEFIEGLETFQCSCPDAAVC